MAKLVPLPSGGQLSFIHIPVGGYSSQNHPFPRDDDILDVIETGILDAIKSDKTNNNNNNDGRTKKKPSSSYPPFTGFTTTSLSPVVDWKETPAAHVIKVEVPGMKKDQLKVDIEDETRLLKITGERVADKKEEGESWRLAESRAGKFVRMITLPENAKLDDVKGKLENGVLTLTVGKTEVKAKVVRSVDIVSA